MTTRQLYVARGRASDTRHFSKARFPDPTKARLVVETLSNKLDEDRRDQILNDSSICSQFAFPWDSQVCFLTRPEYVSVPGSTSTAVLGSASDRLGNVYPVLVPKVAFQGFFTSLVRKDDAEHFSLAQHPTAPDSIRGPPPPATADDATPSPVQASTDRLQFPLESDEDQHSPVIAALPYFLPLPPGCSFPEGTAVDTTPGKFRDDFRLFEVWLQAHRYARLHNSSQSVTQGGPMFLPADLKTSQAPFHGLAIVDKLDTTPTTVSPVGPLGHRCTARLESWADDTWALLGMQAHPITPEKDPSPGQPQDTDNPSPSSGHGALAAPTAKEKAQAKTAATVAAGYRLAFARLPSSDSVDLRHVILPSLQSDFKEVLDSPKPQDACVELKQILTGKLGEANISDLAMSRDVTLEPQICTLSLSNCIRSFHWLDVPLVSTNKGTMETMLGLLHFLTPDHQALLAQVSREVANGPVVLSHVADDKAQLEASTKSRLYTRGRLTSGKDIYHAICNFVLVADLLVDGGRSSMLVTKLVRYANALNSAEGRRFLQTFANHPYLPIHLFQDVQHIITLYFRVAQSHSLRTQVKQGQSVETSNYTAVSRAADLVIDNLNNVILGSGLGRFEGCPHAHSWFSAPAPSHVPRSPPTVDQPPAKRQRGGAATPLDPDRITKAKASGVLVFDPLAAGTKELPLCSVRDTRPGSKTPERLCMPFMTRDHFCSEPNCPRPHISNLKRLSSDKKRESLAHFVSKTPGLSWSPGHAPSGKGSP